MNCSKSIQEKAARFKDGYVDFHIHTTKSDGNKDPNEVVMLAKEAGITTLAITDHNKMMPREEREELEEKSGVRIISGAEVSATHSFKSGKTLEVHIVGLMMEDTETLTTFLKNNKSDDNLRIVKILEKLKNECNINLGSYDELLALFPERKKLGRMQIAQVLAMKGYCENVTEGFDVFVGDYGSRLAHVENPHCYASVNTVIKQIKDAKGIAVLAHPYSYRLDEEQFTELMDTFVEGGGLAVEVYYGKYTEEQRDTLAAIAEERGLIASCGSDYHGNFKEDRLNHKFPNLILRALEQARCRH